MRHDIDFTQLSRREISYLLGFYVGDGNIFIKKQTGVYRLRYFTFIKEFKIQEKLKNLLLKIFKKVYFYEKQDNTLVLEVHSKDLIDFITKNCDKNGLKKKVSKDTERGFIEGLIDSDGYVQRNYVEITTANPKLKNQMIKILKRFRINCNIREYQSPLTKNKGFRVGFSLNGKNFFPVKWISGLQTAG